MLFEQIPAYLEFFGLPTTTPEVLRRVALLDGADGADPQASVRAGAPSASQPRDVEAITA
jgi:hypothetical protein